MNARNGSWGRTFWMLTLIACAPIALIWSINRLFHVGIPVGWAEWLAAAFLLSCLRGRWGRS